MTVKTGVLGVSGYTGQELIKYLLKHPVFQLESLFSTSITGNYAQIYPEFSFYELPEVESFDIASCADLELIFLAVPHTKSMSIVSGLAASYPALRIVDLSADFRLEDVKQFEQYYAVNHKAPDLIDTAVYGLPELYKDQLPEATLCANPGCYATSIILGTLPIKGIS